MIELCPCGSKKTFTQCCQPLILGQTHAVSALALMKSRYCAYVTQHIDYLVSTWHINAQPENLRQSLTESVAQTQWQGLTIVSTETPNPNENYVTFIAKFCDTQTQRQHVIYERSQFIKQDGRWYYTSGTKPTTGRNDPCPCGANKKYKKCCGK